MSHSDADLADWARTRLGHDFASMALLREALTHGSATMGTKSYQRLEFLGDRVLGCIVATMLFQTHAEQEGQLSARFHALRPEASPAWEQVRERLRYVAHGAFEPAVEFVQPSPYVPWHESALAGLRNWAAESLTPGRPVAQAALELMQRLHTQWAYRPRSTGVDTPLVTAFEQRAGVCQDFAHLLIGAWRLWGLPARYASGYLLTEPAAGEPVLVGADASHAWVQLWCPGTPGVGDDGWLDLDPTNNLVPATGHVRVAMGRDFGDVTPLRGVIRGGGVHTLSVGVTTRRWTPAQ
jgi:transglutaminase-like putative cysteine protease